MNSYDFARVQSTGVYLEQHRDKVVGKVLDAGCGSKPYKRLFPECEWVGLDARAVGEIQGDIHEIPCEDASFDTVLCTDTLQFAYYPHIAVKEMCRVLKPGGHLIIVAPNVSPEDKHAFWNFKVASLAMMCADALGIQPQANAMTGLIKTEFDPYRARVKHQALYPADIQGFIDSMDERYPVASVIVAKKE